MDRRRMSRIIPLYHHGKSVDEIVKETGHSVGTVLRIVGHWEEINSYQYLKTIHGPEKPVQPAERLMIQGNTEVAANLNEETSIEQTGNEEKGPNSEEGLSGLEGQNSEKVSLESECINVEEEIVEIEKGLVVLVKQFDQLERTVKDLLTVLESYRHNDGN